MSDLGEGDYFDDDELSHGEAHDGEEDESKHFVNVCYAFQNYTLDAMREVARIEKHFHSVSEDDQALLIEKVESRVQKIKHAVHVNQQFLDLLLQPHRPAIDGQEELMEPLLEPGQQDAATAISSEHREEISTPNHTDTTTPMTPSAPPPPPPPPSDPPPSAGQPPPSRASPPAAPPPSGPPVTSPDQEQPQHESSTSPSTPAGPPVGKGNDKDKEKGGVGDVVEREREACECCPPQDGHGQHVSPLDRLDRSVRPRPSPLVMARNMTKVRSTLRQFVRDWSDEGKAERDAAYGPLLDALDEFLPLQEFVAKHGKAPRVLCPGSGLGRLPFEVIRKGYACQGNEFSYFMLLGSNFILNYSVAPRSCAIQPYCLSTCNRFGHDDHLRMILVPDLYPSHYIQAGQDFSMCAGEFVEVYSPQKAQWDSILTCFFIDTAKNILLYIKTIANAIREGGVWANLGPLLYHFAEMPHEVSVELSWEEIRPVIERYFEIRKEERRDAYYTTNQKSMMQVQYHCVYFVGVRNGVEVSGVSNSVYP
ncbi:unnamed protein product [Vitrella brassicaformis CCMP3155]|uniref:Uncharacterized protein n=2 Tax=Vitrella brassicaformis TaxID=1169539 RepID=A0A0G4FDG3_VITBC|nr:unnamed protein product [Vitrella brassicaformis CCMP3155]|eukprot:CEM10850.1 unnamed protein product [Vitrella brassicaformis CCMP3155]